MGASTYKSVVTRHADFALHRLKINPSTLQIINTEWRTIDIGIARPERPGIRRSLGEGVPPGQKNKYFLWKFADNSEVL